MKILTLSTDNELNHLVNGFAEEYEHQSITYGEGKRPIDYVDFVCEKNPSVMIIDDDYVKPDGAVLITTLKKVKKNIEIIFITSDSSIELGKKISPLGITYYAIKPVDKHEFYDLLNSIFENKLKSTY